VIVKIGENQEEMEVRSPSGDVEVQIVLTANGPVVRLRGARLELESPETVAVDCKRFEVHASEKTELRSEGEVRVTGQGMRVQTQGDIHLNGDYIRLNC
jgi:phage gp45-like